MTESFIPGSDNTEQSPDEQLPEDSKVTSEPTDEEIGDGEVLDEGEGTIEITGQEATDLNEVLTFFHQVLATHEAAINLLAAAVFGEKDESQVPDEGATVSADIGARAEGEVIPVDFGDSDTSDAS